VVTKKQKYKPSYLRDKVVLVSGSSMGIGKAIAIELAAHGAKIVLNGKDSEKLIRTEVLLKGKGYDVTAIVADIRNPEACKSLIKKTIRQYGQLNVLVNNAAVSSRGRVEQMADRNFKILAETNFLGSAYLSKYAIPHLKKTKGHIIFINSVGGFRGMPFNAAYSASKMALTGLAEALRIELCDYGIHVGNAFVGFTENDPRKKILDIDGSWIYLPRRSNIKLAKPEAVAKSIRHLIVTRKNTITLTGLGWITAMVTRYLPGLANGILRRNRNKIEKEYTMIGGEKVNRLLLAPNSLKNALE
jgi:NAD(P)-dependent dehydrogenase (short-subunit alcohol dehydrogenase family)